MQVSVFVLGATGYIGGSVLVAFNRAYPEYKYTALVRNERDKAAIEGIGENVQVVIGSHHDHNLVTKLVSEHTLTLSSADAGDMEAVKAILGGLESQNKNTTDRRPILIHTSGSGSVADAPTGRFNPRTSERIWNDNVVNDIKEMDPKGIIGMLTLRSSKPVGKRH